MDINFGVGFFESRFVFSTLSCNSRCRFGCFCFLCVVNFYQTCSHLHVKPNFTPTLPPSITTQYIYDWDQNHVCIALKRAVVWSQFELRKTQRDMLLNRKIRRKTRKY